jgi:hypothetical protein
MKFIGTLYSRDRRYLLKVSKHNVLMYFRQFFVLLFVVCCKSKESFRSSKNSSLVEDFGIKFGFELLLILPALEGTFSASLKVLLALVLACTIVGPCPNDGYWRLLIADKFLLVERDDLV